MRPSPGRALVFLLGAAVFLNYVDRGAISVAAPLMKDALSLTAFEYGIAVSAFFWVYGPLQLVVGWLCDRFSVYRLLAWGTQPLGALAGGFIAEALGLPAVFLIAAVVAGSLVLLRFIVTDEAIAAAERRGIDEREGQPVPAPS